MRISRRHLIVLCILAASGILIGVKQFNDILNTSAETFATESTTNKTSASLFGSAMEKMKKTVRTVTNSTSTSTSSTLLALGDNKYTTSGAKKGYIYLCNTGKSEGKGGAGTVGPWITNGYWDPSKKVTVDGAVTWKNASATFKTETATRIITTNALPIDHTTGIYPIAATDDAYSYDRNPNSIKTQKISISLPKNPTVAASPSCMGGEVGISLTGVPIFNGFDADHRDAAAYEVQDSYGGHPQVSGMYHYHNISESVEKLGHTEEGSTLVGYAFDGFGIFGATENGTQITNDVLDECHGHTHEIMWDGVKKSMYHYHATAAFPYTVSCFRGTPRVKTVGGGNSAQKVEQSGMQRSETAKTRPSTPPQAAISACSGKTVGMTCSFAGQDATITGTCLQPESTSTLLCIPAGRRL